MENKHDNDICLVESNPIETAYVQSVISPVSSPVKNLHNQVAITTPPHLFKANTQIPFVVTNIFEKLGQTFTTNDNEMSSIMTANLLPAPERGITPNQAIVDDGHIKGQPEIPPPPMEASLSNNPINNFVTPPTKSITSFQSVEKHDSEGTQPTLSTELPREEEMSIPRATGANCATNMGQLPMTSTGDTTDTVIDMGQLPMTSTDDNTDTEIEDKIVVGQPPPITINNDGPGDGASPTPTVATLIDFTGQQPVKPKNICKSEKLTITNINQINIDATTPMGKLPMQATTKQGSASRAMGALPMNTSAKVTLKSNNTGYNHTDTNTNDD